MILCRLVIQFILNGIKQMKIDTKYFQMFFSWWFGILWFRICGYGIMFKWWKETFLFSERNGYRCLNIMDLIVIRFLKPNDRGRLKK